MIIKSHPGFSLLEIIMGIALFSMIGAMLFQSMSQIMKTLKTVNFITSGDMRGSVIATVLERDLGGSCIPLVKIIEEDHANKSGAQKKPEQAESKSDKNSDDKSDNKKSKKKTTKTVPAGFVYEHDLQGNLSLFTFISVNPAAEYNTIKPRPIRVIYRLLEDKEMPGTFVLKRQEIADYMNESLIDQEGSGKIRAVVIISGIKKCVFEFTALEVQEEEDEIKNSSKNLAEKNDPQKVSKKTTEKTKKIEKKLVKHDVWNSNDGLDQDEKNKKQRTLPLIPELVNVSISFAYNDMRTKESVLEVSYTTIQAAETFSLEGIQPVSLQQEGAERLEHLFDEDRVSESLNDKLEEWTKKIVPEPSGSNTVINVNTP